MEISWLEDFISLASTGNFSRSADERNISQSAFSRRIRALEHWLGGDLIDRSRFPTTLTPAGHAFYQSALDVVRVLHRERAEFRGLVKRDARTIRICATHTLAIHFAPAWIAALRQTDRTGELNVKMITADLHDCGQALMEGACDLVLAYNTSAIPSMFGMSRFEVAVIGADVVTPVSAPGEDGSPRHAIAASSGDPFPLLAYAANSYLGHLVGSGLDAWDLTRRARPAYESSLVEALKGMALAGEGIAWLPHSAIQTELKAGRLVSCAPQAGYDLHVEIRAYRRAERERSIVEHVWRALVEMPKDHANSA
ncbi:LysR substrate-binding domain-containing protein [Bosea sp. (in: a-proteobacteria)]|uniref:LysR substrate-binding domain-containing protein n=1 Tax=Bosea sp. (in: a-proteobacteria) TaxID=1871050 RepID=UPI0025C2EF0F|nr:LysR substrate-binding domain-containing protein [Bosea sp. (in: a-proteobacteria)]